MTKATDKSITDAELSTLTAAIDQTRNQAGKLVFIFGAGISENFFRALPEAEREQLEIGSLDGLLWGDLLSAWQQYLKEHAPDGGGAEHISRLLRDDSNVEELLAGAFMIRERLKWCGMWKDAVNEVFGNLVKPLADTWSASAWGSFLKKLTKSIFDKQFPLPFLITTNYDDVIARALDAIVFFSYLGGHAGDGSANSSWVHRSPYMNRKVSVYLRPVDSPTSLHDLLKLGVLEPEDLSVWHLHGWWDESDSIVLDPIDYELSRRQRFSDEQLENTLLNDKATVLFCGVGDGMADLRFRQIFRKISGNAKSVFRNNFWLLVEDENPDYPDEVAANPNLLQSVRFSEYDEIPDYLSKTI